MSKRQSERIRTRNGREEPVINNNEESAEEEEDSNEEEEEGHESEYEEAENPDPNIETEEERLRRETEAETARADRLRQRLAEKLRLRRALLDKKAEADRLQQQLDELDKADGTDTTTHTNSSTTDTNTVPTPSTSHSDRKFKAPSMNRFSGFAKDAVSWIERYERSANAHNWSGIDKVQQAHDLMDDGPAYNWYCAVILDPHNPPDWPQFKTAFLQAFSTTGYVTDKTRELYGSRQKISESPSQLWSKTTEALVGGYTYSSRSRSNAIIPGWPILYL